MPPCALPHRDRSATPRNQSPRQRNPNLRKKAEITTTAICVATPHAPVPSRHDVATYDFLSARSPPVLPAPVPWRTAPLGFQNWLPAVPPEMSPGHRAPNQQIVYYIVYYPDHGAVFPCCSSLKSALGLRHPNAAPAKGPEPRCKRPRTRLLVLHLLLRTIRKLPQ